MKPLAITSLSLLLTTAGFLTGQRWASSGPLEGESMGARMTRIAAGDSPSTSDSAGARSKGKQNPDQQIADFLAKYSIGTGTLSPERMKEVLGEILSDADPIRSELLFARMMNELTPENADAALSTIRERVGRGPESFAFLRMLAYKWGQISPTNAMVAFSDNGGAGGGGGGFGGWGRGLSQGMVLNGWASKDPTAATAWIDSPDAAGGNKGMLSMMLLNGLARTDIDAAIKRAADMKDEGERSRAAQTIAQELIRSGSIDKATDWMKGLTDPQLKKGAMDAITRQLANDPEKALAFVKTFGDQPFASDSVRLLVENASRKDPKEGLKMAAQFTGENRSNAFRGVIREWMRDEGAGSEAASTYVNSMPAGPDKDYSAAEIARRIIRDDPKSALIWNTSIKDPKVRTDSLLEIAPRYARRDRAAFDTWLPTSGLSAEQQQTILRDIDQPDFGDGPRGFGRGDGPRAFGRGNGP